MITAIPTLSQQQPQYISSDLGANLSAMSPVIPAFAENNDVRLDVRWMGAGKEMPHIYPMQSIHIQSFPTHDQNASPVKATFVVVNIFRKQNIFPILWNFSTLKWHCDLKSFIMEGWDKKRIFFRLKVYLSHMGLTHNRSALVQVVVWHCLALCEQQWPLY